MPAVDGAPRARIGRRRAIVIAAAVVLVALLAWPIGLAIWANGKLTHVDALSGAADTPGTTYLLTGSDSRGDGAVPQDGTLGARTDTIMVLQVPSNGPVALISLPRDTYVDVPGHGPAKLNAAFSWGGAPLLVKTVEQLTGLTIDRYAEVGFAGLENLVNAVGGVSLCSDLTVNDPDSGMVWTPGCHEVGGVDALAFARMRKADPTGDIGRAQRQQQLIGAITSKVSTPSLLVEPGTQMSLIRAGTGSLAVSKGFDIVDLGRMAIAFRKAKGPGGITGTPPISNMDYRPGHNLGSTVRLDPDKTPAFFAAIKNGTLPAGAVGGAPTA
jgi:LCP family protein required for cell wall assembly